MKDLLEALKTVYREKGFILLTLILFFLFLVFAIWFPNLGFILRRLFTGGLSFSERIDFFMSTLGALQTNFTFATRIASIVVVLLFSVNSSMFIFYLRRAFDFQRESASSLVGAVLGVIGVGCASCGSVILSSVFGFTVAAGVITFLPFKGLEFSLVSILFLVLSIYWLGRKINQGIVCKIKR